MRDVAILSGLFVLLILTVVMIITQLGHELPKAVMFMLF